MLGAGIVLNIRWRCLLLIAMDQTPAVNVSVQCAACCFHVRNMTLMRAMLGNRPQSSVHQSALALIRQSFLVPKCDIKWCQHCLFLALWWEETQWSEHSLWQSSHGD